MKILFIIRSTSQFYYVKSILGAFIERGHGVQLLFEKTKEKWLKGGDYMKPLEDFKTRYPDIRYGRSYPRTDIWRFLVMPARVLLNYRRFLVSKKQSSYFQNRMLKFLPAGIRLFFLLPIIRALSNKILLSEFASSILYWIEEKAGLDPKIFEQVKSFKPDLVAITVGGMRYGSIDLDYIKAARALGAKSVAVALTWDSLSTKALIQIHPDLLLAWNDMHELHAFEHHGIPKEKVAIAGSYMFDDWFEFIGRGPNPREEFCEKYGLDPKRDLIVYLGSAATTAPDERWLIKEAREALNNSSNPRLRSSEMIFRPHPTRAKSFHDMRIPKVLVLPKDGTLRDSEENMRLLYDTLHHAFSAVTVYTNALIEAIIMNKPVVTLMRREFDLTQSRAEHFKDILLSGAVAPTYSSADLIENLESILAGKDDRREKREAFVKRFIRPRGIRTSAGEAAVMEIEKLI